MPHFDQYSHVKLAECVAARFGAPEVEAQPRGVFFRDSAGGAAGFAQIHDWLDAEGTKRFGGLLPADRGGLKLFTGLASRQNPQCDQGLGSIYRRSPVRADKRGCRGP